VAKVAGRRRYNAQPPKGSGVVIPVLSFLTLTSESSFLEHYMQYVMVAVTMGSIFIGSAFATRKVESKALIVGMAVGCIYVLISVGIGMEITNESITLLILANKFIAGIAAGALGGIIGVNL